MLKWWTKFLLKLLLALFVLLFLFLVFERVRGQISLARYKRELIARGEKLTFQELIPPVPPGENGAPEILAAAEQLKKGTVLPGDFPPMMRPMPSGRAIVGFRESEWVDYNKATNHWDQLAADLRTNEATLAQIRLALEKPVLNNKLDYSQGAKMRLEHISLARQLINWFGPGSLLALHQDQPHEAVDNLVTLIRLPRLLAADRVVVSELMRMPIATIAENATWEALQANGWADEDLARIQQAWQVEEFAFGMKSSLESELASNETAYQQFTRSNEDAVSMISMLEEMHSSSDEARHPWWYGITPTEVYCQLWRFAWLRQDEKRCLEYGHRLIEIARLAAKEKSYASALPLLDRFDRETPNRNFYDEMRFPLAPQLVGYLSGIIKRAMRADTDRAITICAIALKRYSLRHGKYPTSLDALVPEFLPSVPVDYMDGKPMKYHLNADGSFTLYSVGEDGKDGGGDASLPPDKKSSHNLWNRRDFVWPAPATPEEVEVYRKEAAKK